jgi:hypothetical protein
LATNFDIPLVIIILVILVDAAVSTAIAVSEEVVGR